MGGGSSDSNGLERKCSKAAQVLARLFLLLSNISRCFEEHPHTHPELQSDTSRRSSGAAERNHTLHVHHYARTPEFLALPLRISKTSAHSFLDQSTLELGIAAMIWNINPPGRLLRPTIDRRVESTPSGIKKWCN
jgi:hypothetical protein